MILHVDGLDFHYKSTPVLRDVHFSVDEGEVLAIMGPNGVGKTTLLKCMNAIHSPSGGCVMVDGADVFQLRPGQIARRLGYVSQRAETGRMTTFDAVLMGRKPHIRWNVSENDLRIVDSALKRLRLEKLCLRYLDEMSGGEVQKVCIARALVQEPRILLLDEPTSSLDLRNQVEILGLVRAVVKSHHVAAIMTMHDLNQALRYADKFVFLRGGRIHAAADRDSINEAIIEEVYGVRVHMEEVAGRPVVVPMDDTEERLLREHDHAHHHEYGISQ